MRVILLTHGGADLVIERLCGLDGVELAGIYIERWAPPKRSPIAKLKRSLKYEGAPATIRKFLPGGRRESSAPSSDSTRIAAERYGVPVFEVENYHSPEAMEMLRAAGADLGVIYGTNIVKPSVFTIPRLGCINLHQGLVPYYRGGPPVFWELFNGEKEVGLTVHFVAEAVDAGEVVLQRRYPLDYDPSFGIDFQGFIDRFRDGLRPESAVLVAEAVAAIAEGKAQPTAQDLSQGKRYRLPTKREKDEMRSRLKRRLNGGRDE